MSITQPRTPAGSPTGGQFTGVDRPEADIDLGFEPRQAYIPDRTPVRVDESDLAPGVADRLRDRARGALTVRPSR